MASLKSITLMLQLFVAVFAQIYEFGKEQKPAHQKRPPWKGSSGITDKSFLEKPLPAVVISEGRRICPVESCFTPMIDKSYEEFLKNFGRLEAGTCICDPHGQKALFEEQKKVFASSSFGEFRKRQEQRTETASGARISGRPVLTQQQIIWQTPVVQTKEVFIPSKSAGFVQHVVEESPCVSKVREIEQDVANLCSVHRHADRSEGYVKSLVVPTYETRRYLQPGHRDLLPSQLSSDLIPEAPRDLTCEYEVSELKHAIDSLCAIDRDIRNRFVSADSDFGVASSQGIQHSVNLPVRGFEPSASELVQKIQKNCEERQRELEQDIEKLCTSDLFQKPKIVSHESDLHVVPVSASRSFPDYLQKIPEDHVCEEKLPGLRLAIEKLCDVDRDIRGHLEAPKQSPGDDIVMPSGVPSEGNLQIVPYIQKKKLLTSGPQAFNQVVSRVPSCVTIDLPQIKQATEKFCITSGKVHKFERFGGGHVSSKQQDFAQLSVANKFGEKTISEQSEILENLAASSDCMDSKKLICEILQNKLTSHTVRDYLKKSCNKFDKQLQDKFISILSPLSLLEVQKSACINRQTATRLSELLYEAEESKHQSKACLTCAK